MKPHLAHHPRERGVALVTTVIVVAVLAVVAVAFMQSTTTDRLSSRSVANYNRAKLAAEAGLAVAEATLARAMTNDTFIVVANADRQMFVGNGISNSINFSYTPIFSTVSNLSTAVSNIVTAAIPSTNVAGGILFTNAMPGGLSITSPAVSWVYLTDASGQTNARFAYWVEDLGGKLDLSVVGATNASDRTNARRLTGTNPAEIALWSLFSTNSPSDPGNAAATNLVGARSNLVTPATARLVEASVTTNILAELAANLRHDTNEPELIPFGFRYVDEGQAKYNLNTNTRASAVAALAGIINRNLTGFGTRGGGLPAADYVNNLAANIIDFVDADTTPAAGVGYRGVELLPFLNERMTQFVLQGPPVDAGRGRWEIRFATTEYLEFWNLHNRTSPAVALNFSFTNRQPLNYSGLTNFNIATNYTIDVPAMPPGSYFVTNSPTITNVFGVTAFASPVTDPICTLVGNTRTIEYTVAAGSAVYDRGSGSHYSDKPFRPGDLVYFSASYPGLGSKLNIAGLADADFLNSVGDPRATYYMTSGGSPRPQIQPSWLSGNTSFGGRNLQSGMSTARLSREVRMENWGDGGHSGTAGTRGSGTTPPAAGLFRASENDYAPARANPATNGLLARITDLAGIFDPLQWGETNQSAPWPNEPGAWANLTSSATNSTAYAGGHSLRLGRPELTRFTNDGTRAAQLLDIFAAGTNTTGPVASRPAGRINLNTAGTSALRALAAGVFLTGDALALSASGNGSNAVVPASAVDDFVRAATNFRTQKPFYSPSQLNMIGTDSVVVNWPTNAVFGNRTRQTITAGNDALIEEWFARVYPLATVRSRNFLVHVIGQALQTNGLGVISTERTAVQIYLQPMRDGAGLTTNSIPRVIQSWNL